MLNIPENIKQLYRENNITESTRRIVKMRFFDSEIKILYPEDTLFPDDGLFPVDMEPFLVISNDKIIQNSFLITESLCDGENLIFGECNASKFEIMVADISMNVTNKEFILTVEIGKYEMILGIYRVKSFIRQADRRIRKITAYDRMIYFQKDVSKWYNSIKFPTTLKTFRDSLCSYIGVPQCDIDLPLDSIQITKTINPEQISGLNILKAICEINGCFGQIERTGRLKYITIGTSSLFPADDLFPDEDLYPAELINPEIIPYYNPSQTVYEDYVVRGIDKLQIRQEEGDVGVIIGDGENCYTIQGNFLTYGKSAAELLQIASSAYEQISKRLYRPCKILCPALPWVEVGDGIICYTKDDIIETYCLKRTIRGIQNMMDTFESFGEEEQEDDFGISTQIIQLEGKTAVIKKTVEEVSVKVTNLKEFTESQFKITADQILSEVKRAKDSEQSIIKQTSAAIELKVSKGDVSSQLSVEKDKITLSSNRLIVNSTNFQLDGNGNAIFSGKVQGASIIGGTIDIGSGSFSVSQDGSVNIDSGEINIGPISINKSIVDLGSYRVGSGKFGVFYSKNLGIELWDENPDHNNSPAFTLTKNGIRTFITNVGIDTSYVYCKDIYLTGSWWKGWSLEEEIMLLHDAVFNKPK